MKKIKLTIVLVLLVPLFASAQIDCSEKIKTLVPELPYEINSLSKSATCVSGRTYEFVIPLSVGYEYRFVFYAGSAFNNDIHFKIIDMNSNKELINLPGKSETGAKGTCVLMPYFDEKIYKEIYPHFDFLPATTTNFKIIISVDEKPELIKGCISVVILDKEFKEGSFK
jgi:hypothetical protein